MIILLHILANTVNMEPPDEKIYSFDEESYYNYYNVDFDKNANCGNTRLRIRGAGPNDSDTNEPHKIPYLSSKNFVMDGLPHIDAQQTIIQPLNMGLGTVLQKGWSLLETAQQIDAGGVLHIPNRAAMLIANPDTVKESKSRNQRLFCTIMNYIKNDSYWYLLFMTTFQYDGIAVYNYILLNVTIQTPPKVLQEREHYFKEMTMEKLNILSTSPAKHTFATKIYECRLPISIAHRSTWARDVCGTSTLPAPSERGRAL